MQIADLKEIKQNIAVPVPIIPKDFTKFLIFTKKEHHYSEVLCAQSIHDQSTSEKDT